MSQFLDRLKKGEMGGGIPYDWRDDFSADIAAGGLNNTYTSDGKAQRTATDTESKMLQTGGKLTWTGGKATAAWGDPALLFPSVARAAGVLYTGRVTPQASKDFMIGLGSANSGLPNGSTGGNFFYTSASGLYDWGCTSAGRYVPQPALFDFAIALRATGAYCFYRVSNGLWKPFWFDFYGNSDPLYPRILNKNGTTILVDTFRKETQKWLPVPDASDGFTTAFGTTNGLGHGISSGLGAGGSGLTWTQQAGTWGISSGAANCSALAGGLGIATVPCSSEDVVIRLTLTRSAGAAGAVARYTDADNYIYAYHDGTNVAVIQRIAGVESNVIAPNAVTYGAGTQILLHLDGATAQLYYGPNPGNASAGGTTALLTGKNHGLWTNNTAPLLDNFSVFPMGKEGQYNALNRFFSGLNRGGGVAFTFDDADETVYSVAYSYMHPKGLKFTAYLVSDFVDKDANHLTHQQVQEMDAGGCVMGNHGKTHTDFTTLTQAQAAAEMTNCYNALVGWGCNANNAKMVGYPFAGYNATVAAAMTDAGMLAGRTGVNNSVIIPVTDLFNLPGKPNGNGILSTTPQDTIKEWITAARADNRICILILHNPGGVWPLGGAPSDDVSVANFQALIDWCVAEGIPLYGMDDIYALRAP